MSRAHVEREGLSVVIPTWNGRALLKQFLPGVVRGVEAFSRTTGRAAEIVLSDDASDDVDTTAAWVGEAFPSVRFVRNAERRGFAGNANAGVRAARHRWIYLLNNDVALAEDTLQPLVAHFGDPGVFAVASQVYDFETGVLRGAGQGADLRRGFLRIHQRHYVPEPPQAPNAPYLTSFATGGSSLYDRDTFLELGGFDERFAPFAWEDVELSLRAWRLGYEIRFEPRSRVWHKFSSTIGTRFARRRVRTINERNRLWTHWIHLDTGFDRAAHAFFVALRLAGHTLTGRWSSWSVLRQALGRRADMRTTRRDLASRQEQTLRALSVRIRAERERPEVEDLEDATAPVRNRP